MVHYGVWESTQTIDQDGDEDYKWVDGGWHEGVHASSTKEAAQKFLKKFLNEEYNYSDDHYISVQSPSGLLDHYQTVHLLHTGQEDSD